MIIYCGARDLGEALRRIGEGASLIRTKGEAGSGNIVEAVRHMRTIMNEIKMVKNLDKEELMYTAKKIGAPFETLQKVAELGKLPVPNFAAGGIATPADASLMMQLGAETVFVGSRSGREGVLQHLLHFGRGASICGSHPYSVVAILCGQLGIANGGDPQ